MGSPGIVITAPVKTGDVLGNVKYFYNGELVAESDLYATKDVKRSYIKQVFSYVLSIWFLILFGLIVALIIRKKIIETRRKRKIRRARVNAARRRMH